MDNEPDTYFFTAIVALALFIVITFMILDLRKRVKSLESHNATPTQHETAALAEKRNETDS